MDELNYFQRLMDRCKMSGMGTKTERAWLWCMMPLILIDIIIHGDEWDEYYDNDPLWSSFVNEYGDEGFGK